MNRKTLLVHGCWAAAVLLAFGLGSLRRSKAPGEPTSAGRGALPARDGWAPGIFGRSAAAERGAKRNARTAGKSRGGGAIDALFGTGSLAGASLETLAEEAARNPNPINRRLAFARLLEALTPENAMTIREQLVELGINDAEWRDFNYSWGALAGEEAFLFAVDSEEHDMAATLAGWAAARPSEALALLDNLPDNLQGQRNELMDSVVSGLAHNDLALATEVALRLAAETGREGLIKIVTNETLRALGPERAASWSESLPDGPLKGAAMDRVANRYVRKDPVAAAQWAERYANEDYAVRVIEEVGEEWAKRDPGSAVQWLESLPSGNGQAAGLRSAFDDWEDRDPFAAAEHLIGMPKSAQRDAAISGFSTGYAWQDPQSAIAWAEDISDPSLRLQSLTRAGQAYFRRDPDSARAWLETSGLPADVQKAVLNPPRRGR